MEFYLGSLFLGSQRSPKIMGILFEGFCFYVAVLTSTNAGLTQGSRIHLLLKSFLRGMVAEGTQQHCSILSVCTCFSLAKPKRWRHLPGRRQESHELPGPELADPASPLNAIYSQTP